MLSDKIVEPHHRIRFIIGLVVLAVLVGLFWTSSRYPSLNDKALMGGAIELEDPLSFEAHLPITNVDSTLTRILYSTINWLETNRIGMTFGVMLAATFLTLLGYCNRRHFSGGFSNALLGLGIGAPLGVCVNCAAPIARGLHAGGTRIETSLAAMIASPTLNVVVLTMLFSLFPLYLAIFKVGLSVFVILVLVPWLCSLLPASARKRQQPEAAVCAIPVGEGSDLTGNSQRSSGDTQISHRFSVSLMGGVWAFIRDFAKNLWFVVRVTVPLMLLAGFLGALVATLLPPDLLLDQPFRWGTLILVALVGLFAPVPIGFDVVLSAVLLNSGLDIAYVMTLLFALGIFSVYSFFIVSTGMGLRLALGVSGCILLISIAAGIGGRLISEWQTQQALDLLTAPVEQSSNDNLPAPPVFTNVVQNILPIIDAPVAAASMVTLNRKPLNAPIGDDTAESGFTLSEAWEYGIDRPIEFSFADMWPPFWEGRGISSGDIDRDGDLDLAIASTENGLNLYLNDGLGQFDDVSPTSNGALNNLPVFNAVLIDINNDSWLDLFVTTYGEGNYWIENLQGSFDVERLSPVANRSDAILTMAVAFADINHDGFPDAALGNWAAGWYRRVPGEESRNRIVMGGANGFDGSVFQDLEGMPGETLSILFSDINNDGDTDLLVGNDFEQPDIFYHGQSDGGFSPVLANQEIPHSTTTTMSLKTADLHNRGAMSIYAAQIAGRASGVSERLNMQPIERYCDSVQRESDKAICQRNIDIKKWYRAGNSFDPVYANQCQKLIPKDRAECRAMLVKDLAIQKNDPALCALIPVDQWKARAYCDVHFLPVPAYPQAVRDQNIPQILGRNVLLVPDATGQYTDEAITQNLDVGGWSWDVKIGDYDDDGFQDIYIVNGTWVPNEVSPSNLFFRNTGSGSFEEATAEFGLEDYHMTAGATQFDMDGDGDLDMVSVPVNAPPKVMRNNSTGNRLSFVINDAIGNYHGLGAKLSIVYGNNNELQQTREIQLGGGFMSFDAAQVHFGLGDHTLASVLRVRWSDGEVTELKQPFEAGFQYTVVRTAPQPNQ